MFLVSNLKKIMGSFNDHLVISEVGLKAHCLLIISYAVQCMCQNLTICMKSLHISLYIIIKLKILIFQTNVKCMGRYVTVRGKFFYTHFDVIPIVRL